MYPSTHKSSSFHEIIPWVDFRCIKHFVHDSSLNHPETNGIQISISWNILESICFWRECLFMISTNAKKNMHTYS